MGHAMTDGSLWWSLNSVCFRGALAVYVLAAGWAGAAQPSSDLTGPWQLFVDDYLIEKKVDVTRVYHPFEKHASNPIIVADKPWEGALVYLYGTVLKMEEAPRYRMWYHAYSEGTYRMLYATSSDGLKWEKPNLGIVTYRDSTDNNLFMERTIESHNPQIIYTPWDPDPQRKYKLMYFEYGRTPPDFTVMGYYGSASPDGIHWTDVAKTPVFPDSPGDVGNFVWDPLGKRYLGYPKKFTEVRGFNRRCVAYTETKDFEKWPPSKLVLTPDEFDDRWVTKPVEHTDFYGLCGFAYESMYLGFLWVFRITAEGDDGPIFVELVTSHDGVHWERQEEPRIPILPLGEQGAWDCGMVFTPNHPIIDGDKIRLYYGGFSMTHAVEKGAASIGLATLRKDGFVSLDAGATEGSVTTTILNGASGALCVNYAAPRGSVRVEVLDGDGKVFPGYGIEQCKPLTGDSVDAQVSWEAARDLPRGVPFRLRFVLKEGSLYSFRFAGMR